MQEQQWLAERFEAHRARLTALAFRMLGSLPEAEDAVQETWLRLSRAESGEIDNLGGWLTTVAGRVCLDMLRTRASRKEEPLDTARPASPGGPRVGNPEDQAIMADAVGLALLVVLDRLTPAERIGFVLHDMFGVPFTEIAPVLGRTPAAAKKLASRARAKVRGGQAPDADLLSRWRLVDTFLSAIRAGDMQAILALLDPHVVRRADRWAIPTSEPAELLGSEPVARGIMLYARTAERFARLALIDGDPGFIIAPHGRLRVAIVLGLRSLKIIEIDVIAEPARLAELTITLPAQAGASDRPQASASPNRRPTRSRGRG
jgi:RNA polymerase sigma factor (sigma-70 family)